MAYTHETIADIIAWLRRPREGENAYLTLWRDEIADRLEAAHKRELENYDAKIADLQSRVKLWTDRSAEIVKKCGEQYAKLKQVGNSAALREALELIVKERGILDFCRNNLGSKTCEDWDEVYKTLRKWMDKAMSALTGGAEVKEIPNFECGIMCEIAANEGVDK